jgi:hypothetical protein
MEPHGQNPPGKLDTGGGRLRNSIEPFYAAVSARKCGNGIPPVFEIHIPPGCGTLASERRGLAVPAEEIISIVAQN